MITRGDTVRPDALTPALSHRKREKTVPAFSHREREKTG